MKLIKHTACSFYQAASLRSIEFGYGRISKKVSDAFSIMNGKKETLTPRYQPQVHFSSPN